MKFAGEQINSFDKEKFTREFREVLEKYTHASGELARLPYRSYNEKEKNELRNDEKETYDKMVQMSIEALKLTNNKQEIFDITHKVFWDSGAQLSGLEPANMTSGRKIENFYKEIILGLVKK